jgi:hypothetical protein
MDSQSAIVSTTAPHMVAMDTTALERIRKGSNGLDDTPTPRIGQDSVIDSDKSTGFTEKHV